MPGKSCKAHRSLDGEPCGNWALRGQDVCRYHGGSAPQAKAAAAKRIVISEAEGLLSKYGDPDTITDPLGQLLLVAGRFTRLSLALEAKVDELTTVRYENLTGGEMLRAEISAYTTVLDRCRAVLVDILRLDIETRIAAVRESQAATLAQALDAALAAAGLQDRAAEVKGHVASHLRVVPG